MSEGEWLTIREGAERLGVSRETVRRWIVGGRIEAEKVGRSFRIAEEQLSLPAHARPRGVKAETGRRAPREPKGSEVDVLEAVLGRLQTGWEPDVFVEHPDGGVTLLDLTAVGSHQGGKSAREAEIVEALNAAGLRARSSGDAIRSVKTRLARHLRDDVFRD